ncbi:MAG: hypothetical protein M3Q78_11165 [Acidobacteriota bacterium]|jgi:hypothetical protein|nr:hypothetical protein [Acidobacteriota bacterium]
MEAIKQTVTVPNNREVTVKFPKTAIPNETAEIIILFRGKKSLESKLAEMDLAAKDDLYLADIKEIQNDFQFADFEVSE